jgi:hypothetical protein
MLSVDEVAKYITYVRGLPSAEQQLQVDTLSESTLTNMFKLA